MSGNNEHLGSAANGGGEAVGSPEEGERRLNPGVVRRLGALAVAQVLENRYEAAKKVDELRQEQGREALAELAKLLTPEALADGYQEAIERRLQSIAEGRNLSGMDLSFFGIVHGHPVANDMVDKLIAARMLVPTSPQKYEYKLNSAKEEARKLLTSVEESCEGLDENAETRLNELTVDRITKTTKNAEGEDVETSGFKLCVNFVLSGPTVDKIEKMQRKTRALEESAS